MRTLLPFAAAFALATLLPMPALCADPARETVELKFRELDRNGDQQITPAELPMPKIFKFLDRDGDGKVLLEEAVAAMPAGVPGVKPTGLIAKIAGPAGPHPVSAAEVGIGTQLADLSLTGLDGKTHQLSQLLGTRGMVIAFASTTCPVSQRYTPSLGRLSTTLREQGISFVAVAPFASEKPEALQELAAALPGAALVVHDRDKSVATALRGRSTAELILLDERRTVLYRGALDDQYGVGYSKEAPEQNYLATAVESMLAGQKVIVAATSAPGCELDLTPASQPLAEVTYHGEVQRILQQNCAECHHEGGIAPFSLEDLDEVKDRAKVIKRVVEDGTMPPWFAVPAEQGKPSPWANDRALSTESKAQLLAWLDSPERPVGNVAEAPKAVEWPKGWSLGEPDAIVSIDKPIEIKAEGVMSYVTVTVPTNFTEDRWVSAVEVQPEARSTVHHVLISAVSKEQAARGGNRIDETSYFAVYVPGTSAERFPKGMAKRLPAGSSFRFQLHYTPNGKATTDITRLGLHFTTEAPKWEIRTAAAINPRINIPAGSPHHKEVAQLPVQPNVLVLGFFPHMHVRGKAFRYELLRSDGTSQTILDIPRYDFNWQLGYQLAEPFITDAGTVLRATAWYDNSPNNKANPDPGKNVRWGPQTYEEMMLGYVRYAVPLQPPAETAQR